MRRARVLRIDHVMGLHRLFWVPREFGPDQGVYVRSRPEELYAILSVEAHRAGAVVVGEDLGTVPPTVRGAMRRHGIYRSYVMQEELRIHPTEPLRRPPPDAQASLNTHDMPTFASFWRGLDIEDRERRGWLDRRGSQHERHRRARLRRALIAFLRRRGLLPTRGRASDADVLRACLRYLAAGESAMLTVALEDLWQETVPQNVPGTSPESEPNWRRKLARTVPAFRRDPDVVGTLAMIDRTRKGVAR
jgi:4-alpha-glucanotransferase